MLLSSILYINFINDSIRYDALSLINLKDNIANVICCVKIFIYWLYICYSRYQSFSFWSDNGYNRYNRYNMYNSLWTQTSLRRHCDVSVTFGRPIGLPSGSWCCISVQGRIWVHIQCISRYILWIYPHIPGIWRVSTYTMYITWYIDI